MKQRLKKVEVLQPYNRNCLPFLMPLFQIIKNEGYKVKERAMLSKVLNALSYRFPLYFSVNCFVRNRPAYLLFMSAIHTNSSLFPYSYNHEIIPIIWDCWPKYRYNIERMLKVCSVNMCFFTSSQTADYFKSKYPALKVFYIPEVFDKSLYYGDKEFSNKNIDVIEYGRSSIDIKMQLEKLFLKGYNVKYPKAEQHLFDSFDDLARAISDSKVAITFPRSITNPSMAQNIETLTQRYWECMYSKTIMVGKAPRELKELLGYNPVIECDMPHVANKIEQVLSDIDSYKSLVEKNYKASRTFGDFRVRLLSIINILLENGYQLICDKS